MENVLVMIIFYFLCPYTHKNSTKNSIGFAIGFRFFLIKLHSKRGDSVEISKLTVIENRNIDRIRIFFFYIFFKDSINFVLFIAIIVFETFDFINVKTSRQEKKITLTQFFFLVLTVKNLIRYRKI